MSKIETILPVPQPGVDRVKSGRPETPADHPCARRPRVQRPELASIDSSLPGNNYSRHVSSRTRWRRYRRRLHQVNIAQVVLLDKMSAIPSRLYSDASPPPPCGPVRTAHPRIPARSAGTPPAQFTMPSGSTTPPHSVRGHRCQRRPVHHHHVRRQIRHADLHGGHGERERQSVPRASPSPTPRRACRREHLNLGLRRCQWRVTPRRERHRHVHHDHRHLGSPDSAPISPRSTPAQQVDAPSRMTTAASDVGAVKGASVAIVRPAWTPSTWASARWWMRT
jgi:hypothetical protein